MLGGKNSVNSYYLNWTLVGVEKKSDQNKILVSPHKPHLQVLLILQVWTVPPTVCSWLSTPTSGSNASPLSHLPVHLGVELLLYVRDIADPQLMPFIQCHFVKGWWDAMGTELLFLINLPAVKLVLLYIISLKVNVKWGWTVFSDLSNVSPWALS